MPFLWMILLLKSVRSIIQFIICFFFKEIFEKTPQFFKNRGSAEFLTVKNFPLIDISTLGPLTKLRWGTDRYGRVPSLSKPLEV